MFIPVVCGRIPPAANVDPMLAYCGASVVDIKSALNQRLVFTVWWSHTQIAPGDFTSTRLSPRSLRRACCALAVLLPSPGGSHAENQRIMTDGLFGLTRDVLSAP